MKKYIKDDFPILDGKCTSHNDDVDEKTIKTQCELHKKIFQEDIKGGIQFAIKQSIPLIPSEKQVVLGTSRYLLPYFLMPEKFITFSFVDSKWTIELNNLLIDCIGINFYKTKLIRIVTTPQELINPKKNTLRVTGKELCILKHKYGLKFYKYMNPYHNNVYFAALKVPAGCKLVSVDKKSRMICDGQILPPLNLQSN